MKHLMKAVAAAFVIALLYAGLSGMQTSEEAPPGTRNDSIYEAAVSLIKRYETIHQPRHWPFVGYGHKILPGEKFSRTRALSEEGRRATACSAATSTRTSPVSVPSAGTPCY